MAIRGDGYTSPYASREAGELCNKDEDGSSLSTRLLQQRPFLLPEVLIQRSHLPVYLYPSDELIHFQFSTPLPKYSAYIPSTGSHRSYLMSFPNLLCSSPRAGMASGIPLIDRKPAVNKQIDPIDQTHARPAQAHHHIAHLLERGLAALSRFERLPGGSRKGLALTF